MPGRGGARPGAGKPPRVVSQYDRKPVPYTGPVWIGKPITPAPIERGPGWIGQRIPYRTKPRP